MKPTELRIGNYVFGMTDTYVDREDKIDVNVFKVALLAEDVIKLDIGFGALESYEQKPIISRRLNELKPIPLTEQWLLKFGFEKTESDYEIQIQKNDKGGNTDYWIYVDSGFDNETKKFTIKIVCQESCWMNTKNKYVHQLQNIYYALTGEELKLKQ